MLAETELAAVAPKRDTVLTVGVFDGVHLGHKHLIAEVRRAAGARGDLAGVVTFQRHPVEMLDARTNLPYLTSLEEKLRLLKAEGVDLVVALTFNQDLANLSAEQFVSMLVRYLRMRGLIVGPDFALGRRREGDVGTLTVLGEKLGFFVKVVAPLKINEDVVSSTAIRQALAAGDMSKVAKLTGRPYRITGNVVSGQGQGRRMGFPTANLNVETGWAIPGDGVYATLTHINGKTYRSMTNIGLRPTVPGKGRTVETYILDYSGDLYGKEVSIDIISWLREEKKFSDVEELKMQIAEDVSRGRSILNSDGLSGSTD